MSSHHDKAQRYIASLEAARVAGTWQEFPELIRKITKHAPNRNTLISTAKLESDVASYACRPDRRPITATPRSASDAQVTALEKELGASKTGLEDVVQAQTAILWARWTGCYKTDRPVPPITFEPVRTAADASSVWTKICVMKAVYMRALYSTRTGDHKQGIELLEGLLPWLDANRSLVVVTPQLLYWAQQVLARVALGSRESLTDTADAGPNETATVRLQAFRHWAVLAVKNADVSSLAFGNTPGHLSKSEIWRAYYRFMSAVLQNRGGLSQHVSFTRSDLVFELRRVETSCETEILRSTQFPKATEPNTAIEDWVEQFVQNWHVLCGPGWADADLGEGGRNSLGRNVLDMLYRAATKSFHSTLILRRLFQVHKALTDSDLAYKALDTYIELMDRARSRSAKSGNLQTPATARDNDSEFMKTIAEGIEGLCSFGGRKEAEIANELCDKLIDLLDELEPDAPVANGVNHVNGQVDGDTLTHAHLPTPLPPALVDTSYRALGIGKAHWARWTPFSENRSDLQTEALEYLQKAAAQDLQHDQHLRTLYALALIHAESRDIDQAIATVKTALSIDMGTDAGDSTFELQRQLIPFWHLLSLLLTSRQSFDTASRSCAAAFEQFTPSGVLFGANNTIPRSSSRKVGLVDDMECHELQNIIELRITELALNELVEGPDHAVNVSNDLLALYSRLFGRLGVVAIGEDAPRKKSIQPPKSSHGTVKSLPSRIFHRRKADQSNHSYKAASSINEESPRPITRATQAPAIHVTNEDEKQSPHKHKLFHKHDKTSAHQVSSPPTAESRLSRSVSRGRLDGSQTSSMAQSFQTTHETTTEANGRGGDHARLETIQSSDVPEIPVSPAHNTTQEAKQPLKEIPHNLGPHEKVPLPAQHQQQPPEQDVRLPVVGPGTLSTDPVPRFPKIAAQRHALSILVKLWLVVAMLYRRANMFEDAREAADEAAKVASKVESMVASVESSARAFRDGGWGCGGKSSDELWADVYCERAELLMAIARAREEKGDTAIAEIVRDAVESYEQCLMYFADHPGGIVGLSNVLLDYCERKVELARRVDNGKPKTDERRTRQEQPRRPKHQRERSHVSTNSHVGLVDVDGQASHTATTREEDLKKTPDNLNRLAARDRAYGLLSTLTKLGSGWDNAEAWYALARAHELGGEVDKAKEILWWCVELEDTRPIRHWRNVGCGGYVL